MALPARRTRPRSGIERNGPARCPQHLAWVRTHRCSVPGCDSAPIEAAHVRIGTDGGTAMKPSDCWVISLCADHHAEQHRVGERSFEARHVINMRLLALEFAAKSPSWQRFLAKQREER
ncbi:putative HNHc nuclease [Azospirillum argentinense]|uniref:HNHc nuclease n=1 Tax=Azospirillum argentinense TaxID=2970906 RepID=A0ABW8V8C4_9PROT